MYRIMIKHSVNSTSAMANKLFEVYGNEITSTSATGTSSTFTPFETDDATVLATELAKLDSIYGHENIMVCKIIDVTYGVEITDDEEGITEPSEPTDPDDTTGDDTGDGEDTDVTP